MEQRRPFPQKLPRLELVISEDRRANDQNEIVFVQFTGKRGYAGREYTSEMRMPCRKRTPPRGGVQSTPEGSAFPPARPICLPGRRINIRTQHKHGAARTCQASKQSGDYSIRESSFAGYRAGKDYLKASWNTGSPVIIRNRKIHGTTRRQH